MNTKLSISTIQLFLEETNESVALSLINDKVWIGYLVSDLEINNEELLSSITENGTIKKTTENETNYNNYNRTSLAIAELTEHLKNCK